MTDDSAEIHGAPVRDLETRMVIEDFLNDCAHAIDDGEVSRWPDFFTDDGFYQIISLESFQAGLPVGVMTCDGRGMMIDRAKALAEANIYEPHRYCHILGRPSLTETPAGEIFARSNFTVIRTMQNGEQSVFASGKYLDRITRETGQPQLRQRRVILDSRRIDILLVLPL